MGLYRKYGVEYAIRLPNFTYRVLISCEDMDSRLLESDYYLKRKEYYENNYKEWREFIDEEFPLTINERVLIENETSRYPECQHGWYDVSYINSTI